MTNLKKYGITLEDYDRMYESQNGVCAICLKPETTKDRWRRGGIKRLAVDHDHETGAVRGLLCDRCNKALGCFRDDPELVRAALDYLISYAPDENLKKRRKEKI